MFSYLRRNAGKTTLSMGEVYAFRQIQSRIRLLYHYYYKSTRETLRLLTVEFHWTAPLLRTTLWNFVRNKYTLLMYLVTVQKVDAEINYEIVLKNRVIAICKIYIEILRYFETKSVAYLRNLAFYIIMALNLIYHEIHFIYLLFP